VDFAAHIEAFRPTFCKVLVRYNPEGDRALNQRQAERLRRLSEYLRARGESRFMFELLVPAESAELEEVEGDAKVYDRELRPGLMVWAIEELQAAGVEPDVWKVEGLDRREDCMSVVAAARRDGRDRVGCIILGRGENDAKVRDWLNDRRWRAGLHRVRRRSHHLLGSARGDAGGQADARGRCRRNRSPLSNLGGGLRKGPRRGARVVRRPSRSLAMQLGMIGLGRMGANMVCAASSRRATSAWSTTARPRRWKRWSTKRRQAPTPWTPSWANSTNRARSG